MAVRGKQLARDIFHCAVEAVKTERLVCNTLRRHGDQLVAGKETFNLNHNVHVIGFGKGVGGMCAAVQNILGDHIVGGVLSVPYAPSSRPNLFKFDKIKVRPGAENNSPDNASYDTTQKIMEICRSAESGDLVLTLITGGGSALLNSPIPPITIEDMCEVIRMLTTQGATIQEVNIVRQLLSQVKGGKLAEIAFPATMWSMILSDIVGDPLHLIASGPTVRNPHNSTHAMSVLDKYGLTHSVPASVLSVLNDAPSVNRPVDVSNMLVGSNKMAVETACTRAKELGCNTLVLSMELQGEARDIGVVFIRLATMLARVKSESWSKLNHELETYLRPYLTESSVEEFIGKLQELVELKQTICIIGAGESTVTLTTGHGTGGRNQEMVLSAIIELAKSSSDPQMTGVDVCFLSCGTDGQDGPTDAAGAVVCTSDTPVLDVRCAEEYLRRNDSNTFFQQHYEDGLVVCGLTGTNVMDIQVLLISSLN